MKLSRQIRAQIAWLKSFFKREWRFKDYPIDSIDQGVYPISASKRSKHYRWRADILGSHICGLGDDQQAALADAKAKFVEYQQTGAKMRRPGSRMQVTFASSDLVDRFPDLQRHFVNTVLKLQWAFLSDESTLWDFHGELDNSELLIRIWHVYGVDVSQIENGNIALILTAIMEEIREFPEDEINKAIRMSRDFRDRRVAGLPIPPWIQAEDDEELRDMGIEP